MKYLVDLFPQCLGGKWFYDVLADFGLGGDDDLFFVVLGGHHDKRGFRQGVIVSDMLQQFETVHPRHVPVAKDKAYILIFLKKFQGFLAIFSLDQVLVADLRHQGPDDAAKGCIVIYYQYFYIFRHVLSPDTSFAPVFFSERRASKSTFQTQIYSMYN